MSVRSSIIVYQYKPFGQQEAGPHLANKQTIEKRACLERGRRSESSFRKAYRSWFQAHCPSIQWPRKSARTCFEGPFGEVIRATGPMAKGNPIRFSTQYTDDETDLVCYLHRYYSPSTGRWPNHDPINELGFKKLTRHNERFNRKEESNLYRFVANNPLIYYDLSGLRGCGKCGPDVTVAVDNTLKAIGDMFAKNPSAQGDMCDALFNPERANGAWDITDLAAAGMSDNSPFDGHPTTGSGSCKRTVVYHGKCIFAGALNYAAFGKMCQLCNKSLFMAELAVTYRKNWQLGDFSCAAAQAFDATAIGYQNSVPWWATGVPITGSCPDCDTSNSRPISETQLHGQWAGNVF